MSECRGNNRIEMKQIEEERQEYLMVRDYNAK